MEGVLRLIRDEFFAKTELNFKNQYYSVDVKQHSDFSITGDAKNFSG